MFFTDLNGWARARAGRRPCGPGLNGQARPFYTPSCRAVDKDFKNFEVSSVHREQNGLRSCGVIDGNVARSPLSTFNQSWPKHHQQKFSLFNDSLHSYLDTCLLLRHLRRPNILNCLPNPQPSCLDGVENPNLNFSNTKIHHIFYKIIYT